MYVVCTVNNVWHVLSCPVLNALYGMDGTCSRDRIFLQARGPAGGSRWLKCEARNLGE